MGSFRGICEDQHVDQHVLLIMSILFQVDKRPNGHNKPDNAPIQMQVFQHSISLRQSHPLTFCSTKVRQNKKTAIIES